MKTVGKAAAGPVHGDDELLTPLLQAIVAVRQVVSRTSLPSHGSNRCECDLLPVNLRDLAAAFAEVAQLQSTLPNSGAEISPEIVPTLSHYKSLLSQFKEDMPRIHGWLLAERARLATRRSHSASVERWVRAAQQTR